LESEHRAPLILSIGHDLNLLSTRHLLLQSDRYIAESTSSIEHAITSLRDGDFDLVILCHSLSGEERKLLIHRIREDNLSLPVVLVATKSIPYPDRPATSNSGTDPAELLHNVKVALQQKGRSCLIRTQGLDGVDGGGALRGNNAGNERATTQRHDRAAEHERVPTLDVVEL
jgi:DNA-binding response OmpR family regulator